MLGSKSINQLKRLEYEYYFDGKNSICLGNTKNNKLVFYMYKAFPNLIF